MGVCVMVENYHAFLSHVSLLLVFICIFYFLYSLFVFLSSSCFCVLLLSTTCLPVPPLSFLVLSLSILPFLLVSSRPVLS